MKNTNAIDKIIKELSLKDYKAQYNRLTKAQKYKYKIGKYQFSYALSYETNKAIEIKNDYVSGNITEEQYKAYCLKYNLLNR